MPDDLDGNGESVASEINRHLLDAWNSPACFFATGDNEPKFREWFEKGCRRAPNVPLQEATILLAVRRSPQSTDDWLELEGRGIYLQVLDEDDGHIVWNSDNVLVLAWDSETALVDARQPVILKCRITTTKAGPDSRLRGTNQSAAPVAGFEAVLWDDAELRALQASRRDRRAPVHLWSGREAQVYDFEFPSRYADSSGLDGSVRPKYQFHLEVESVILPAERATSRRSRYVWARESFSVVRNRKEARLEESRGYFVEPEREQRILEYLKSVLFVEPFEAKVLPYSHVDRLKVGKRVSIHPLHETFLGPEWKDKKLRDDYYERAEPGSLVAELDPVAESQGANLERREEPLPRLQRVFTAPVDRLLEVWAEAASRLPHSG